MKPILLVFAVCLSLSAGVASAGDFPPSGESQVYWKSGRSTMKAFDNVGRRTQDTGAMHGIGFSSEISDVKSAWRLLGEVAFGSSDHDVFDASDSTVYSGNSTAYAFKGVADYLYRIPAGRRSTIEPTVGVEGRWSRREISDGNKDSWMALNLRLGLQLLFHDSISSADRESPSVSTQVWFRAEGGLLLPGVLNMKIHGLSKNQAGLRPSYYGECGPVLGAFRPVLYYEGLRLRRSPVISDDTVGIRLGWAF